MTLPVLVLVGRPNVGKSTLFNRLTGSRDALVADLPGLTRDRQYGFGTYLAENKRFVVVDTGGLFPESDDALAVLAEEQARIAISEADRILFVTDYKQGLLGGDQAIARELRKLGKPVQVVVNKAEGESKVTASAEFHALGLGEPLAISADNGEGVGSLLRGLLLDFPAETEAVVEENRIRVAIIGKPNAGKSTLVNRLVGEERVLSSDRPGTTRDAIEVPFTWEGQDFTLIDTAGIRRKSRTHETIEKFSIVKALQAIDSAEVVLMMVDAQDEIATQDARLMGLVAHRGRALVLAVNKWDGLDNKERQNVKSLVDYRLPFLDHVPLHYISAKFGGGLKELMQDLIRVRTAVNKHIPTSELAKSLEKAIELHAPPAVLGRRIKLKFANQSGIRPTVLVIHGNQTDKLPESYHRYLMNHFRKAFDLIGVPVQLTFKNAENPFKPKKDDLTTREQMRLKRLERNALKNPKK